MVSRSNEWLASRGDDVCAIAQRCSSKQAIIGGVQGEIDGEKQGEGEAAVLPGEVEIAAGSGARCRVARGCPRGPEPSAASGWWLEGASARWDLCGLVLVRMQIGGDARRLQIKRCGDEDDGDDDIIIIIARCGRRRRCWWQGCLSWNTATHSLLCLVVYQSIV